MLQGESRESKCQAPCRLKAVSLGAAACVWLELLAKLL